MDIAQTKGFTIDDFAEATRAFDSPTVSGDCVVVLVENWPTAAKVGAVQDPDNAANVFDRVATREGDGGRGSLAAFVCNSLSAITNIRLVPDPDINGDPVSGGNYGELWLVGVDTPAEVTDTATDLSAGGPAPSPGTLTPVGLSAIALSCISTSSLGSPQVPPSGDTLIMAQPDNSSHIAGAASHSDEITDGNPVTPTWDISPAASSWYALGILIEPTGGASDQDLTGATIASTGALFAGVLSMALVGATIASTSVIHAPTMALDGNLAGAHIASTSQLFAPTISTVQTLTGAHIGSTSALHAPTIAVAPEFQNAWTRIVDESSVFVELPDPPEIGSTILVGMNAWQWTTEPAGEGVDPQSSWLTDNNGAIAGDYLKEAEVTHADQGGVNDPGCAIFRYVVTDNSVTPYRITATGAFDWGGLCVLNVPGLVDAPPQDWSKDWRPTAENPGIPPDIVFGTMENTTDHVLQFAVGRNNGHGNGLNGPGEGTVGPPRQTGTDGYQWIAFEGHNSDFLAFTCWYRVVSAFEVMTPLQALTDLDGATFTRSAGVQAAYGFADGVGEENDLAGAHIASGSTFHQPTASPSIEGATIGSTSVLHAPSIGLGLDGAHIPSDSALSAPTLSLSVQGETIASTSAFHTPAIGLSIEGGTIASTSALFAPTIAHALELTGATIASTSVLHAGAIGLSLSGATIPSGSVLHQPVISQDGDVVTAHIDSTSTLHPPALVMNALGAHIPSTSVLHAPTLAIEGSIEGATIPSTSTLHAPSLSANLAGAHIASTSELFEPSITAQGSIAGAHIPSPAQLFAPTIALSLAGETIASTSTFHTPAAVVANNQTMEGAHIGSGSQFFTPTIAILGAFLPGSGSAEYLTPRRTVVME